MPETKSPLIEFWESSHMQYIPELLTQLQITRKPTQSHSIHQHQVFIPMDFKRTMETEREESLKQSQHIQRIRELNQHIQEIYGGVVIADYAIKKLGAIEVVTFLDESVVALQPLEQRLTTPTTLIYAMERAGVIEYLLTVFHPMYTNPIHLFLNENNLITRVAVERGDPRSTRTLYYGDLTEFFKEIPVDYVQENLEIIHAIKARRAELGF